MIDIGRSISPNNKQWNIHTWRTLVSDSTSVLRRVRLVYFAISCSSSKSSSNMCSGNWTTSFVKIVCFDSKYLIHASIVISRGPGQCSSSRLISSSSFKYASRTVWSLGCHLEEKNNTHYFEKSENILKLTIKLTISARLTPEARST